MNSKKPQNLKLLVPSLDPPMPVSSQAQHLQKPDPRFQEIAGYKSFRSAGLNIPRNRKLIKRKETGVTTQNPSAISGMIHYEEESKELGTPNNLFGEVNPPFISQNSNIEEVKDNMIDESDSQIIPFLLSEELKKPFPSQPSFSLQVHRNHLET